MAQYIDKDALVAEIDKRLHQLTDAAFDSMIGRNLTEIKDFIDALEAIDPYEQCVQYQSVKDAIKVHAETYSFNIESMLFPQLTKEQQKLWRKEIEQACISGGNKSMSIIMTYTQLSKKEERERFEKSQQEFYDKHVKNRNKKQEGE